MCSQYLSVSVYTGLPTLPIPTIPTDFDLASHTVPEDEKVPLEMAKGSLNNLDRNRFDKAIVIAKLEFYSLKPSNDLMSLLFSN